MYKVGQLVKIKSHYSYLLEKVVPDQVVKIIWIDGDFITVETKEAGDLHMEQKNYLLI